MLEKKGETATNEALKTVLSAAESFDKALETAEKELRQTVHPFRENALQRFPVLFLLAITFGTIMTEFGLQQIFAKYDLFVEKPWLILSIGLGVLILTGVAYKRSK